jgi:hypothetical protein
VNLTRQVVDKDKNMRQNFLGAWCLVLGAWCLVLGAWCLVLGAWCLVLGAKPNLWPNEKTDCRAESVIIDKNISLLNKNCKRVKNNFSGIFSRRMRFKAI